MFGLFKKKDKHDEAINLIRTYFRSPFFNPSRVEWLRIITINRPELTKEDLAIHYLTVCITEDCFDGEYNVLAAEKESVKGYVVNVGMAIAGMKRANVDLNNGILSSFRELAHHAGVGEQIFDMGI